MNRNNAGRLARNCQVEDLKALVSPDQGLNLSALFLRSIKTGEERSTHSATPSGHIHQWLLDCPFKGSTRDWQVWGSTSYQKVIRNDKHWVSGMMSWFWSDVMLVCMLGGASIMRPPSVHTNCLKSVYTLTSDLTCWKDIKCQQTHLTQAGL